MTDTDDSGVPAGGPPGSEPPADEVPQAPDRREPDDSLQRRLVESVQAFEVDPPAPERTNSHPS